LHFLKGKENLLSSNIDPLVVEYIETKNEVLKAEIVLKYRSLVGYIARKLAYNKSDFDDLVQVGSIAVIKCLDRFELDKGADFATFATPNIIGEIKHYFRDKSKVVKVPRKLQELYSKIKTVLAEYQQKGEFPTVAALAHLLDESEEKIIEAMESGQNSRLVSLDTPNFTKDGGSSNSSSMIDNLLVDSSNTEETFLNKEMLKQAILKLNSRERRIIYLRFYGELSQTEIAERLDLSQMHISRLLTNAIRRLREELKRL
jgi:RNA polymerase sigma-B factor